MNEAKSLLGPPRARRPRVARIARLSLGGVLVGYFLGIYLGAFAGLVYGALVGELALAFDGALVGGGIVAAAGAVYGAALGITEKPESFSPRQTREDLEASPRQPR